MATLYKLTTQDNKTRKGYLNETTWGPGVTHSGTGDGDLCGPGYIHAYTDPLLAVLLNPIHANIKDPKLWICEGEIVKEDRGLKVGCVTLTTISEIPLPMITTEQRVKFAILCAKQVCEDDPAFNLWATTWLTGVDRSGRNTAMWSAKAAAMWSAKAKAKAKVEAAAMWSVVAAEAAWAAEAMWSAKAAEAMWSAKAAAKAATAAEAAVAAAEAAAMWPSAALDLITLAHEAVLS